MSNENEIIIDLKDSPYSNSTVANGFDSVSTGKVKLKDGYPSCVKHGAMNKVDASGLWRCLVCNEGCYQTQSLPLGVEELTDAERTFSEAVQDAIQLAGQYTEEQKQETIQSIAMSCAKGLEPLFYMFQLKNGIECKIIEQSNGDEFLLSFKKVSPTPPVEEGSSVEEVLESSKQQSFPFEKEIVGKNIHSVYTLCFECRGWGVNAPLEKNCGNCGHKEGKTYYDAETIHNFIASQQTAKYREASERIAGYQYENDWGVINGMKSIANETLKQ